MDRSNGKKKGQTNQMKRKLLLISILWLSFGGMAAFAQTQRVRIIWQQNAHPGGAASVEFSPDGQRLVSGGAYIVQSGAQLFYGQNKLWAAQDGTLLAQTPQDQSIGGTNEVSFSPGGQKVATANGSVYCYPKGGCGSVAPGLADYSTPQLNRLHLQYTQPINATIDSSPDGQLIATGEFYGDFQIRIRSASDLSVIRSLPGHSAGNGNVGTYSVRFSPDGTLLASGGVDGNVKIWRISDGVLLRTLPIGSESTPNVFSVAFSPDGQLIAGGTDALHTINVWRVNDGSLFRTFSFGNEVFGYGQTNLAWTPDGVFLAGGRTVYPTPLAIRFWNVTTGQLTRELTDNTGRAIYSIAFAPNGRKFAYAASHDVVVALTPRLR